MGEAKRRRTYNTLDGGPPDDTPTAFRLRTIEPGNPELGLTSLFDAMDKARVRLLPDLLDRFTRPPPMLCGACDHEFTPGLQPALLYWTEPMFPKADAFQSITGTLCAACASDLNSACHRIARYLSVAVIEVEGYLTR
jgi:hypothetical protein